MNTLFWDERLLSYSYICFKMPICMSNSCILFGIYVFDVWPEMGATFILYHHQHHRHHHHHHHHHHHRHYINVIEKNGLNI